jgi:hypothetical protein
MPKSQEQMILDALRRGERLTGLDILRQFNCMNYKGRISDLRRDGHPIKTKMIELENGKRIAEYSLLRPGEQLEFLI